MQLYPAIDIQSQQCVRLYQGQFDQSTIYGIDPLNMINQFALEGASFCHVVDLDGAQNPDKSQRSFIQQLIQQSSLSVQIGGGIRFQSQIEEHLISGAKRVVIGSAAIENPDEVKYWLRIFGSDAIAIALDVKKNAHDKYSVFTKGWQHDSQLLLETVIEDYLAQGLKHVICTDISLDGTLQGPNFNLYKKIKNKFPTLLLQASGGIATLDDIRELNALGVNGAILGKALYEKKFSFKEALAC